MVRGEIEALVAALEECAETLERLGWREPGLPRGGSLPWLRPPSFHAPSGRGAPVWGRGDAEAGRSALAHDALELAAEFRDVAEAATAGQAGRGWINSLIGRASRHLEPELLERVRSAALGLR